jgi:hypothetical protein
MALQSVQIMLNKQTQSRTFEPTSMLRESRDSFIYSATASLFVLQQFGHLRALR